MKLRSHDSKLFTESVLAMFDTASELFARFSLVTTGPHLEPRFKVIVPYTYSCNKTKLMRYIKELQLIIDRHSKQNVCGGSSCGDGDVVGRILLPLLSLMKQKHLQTGDQIDTAKARADAEKLQNAGKGRFSITGHSGEGRNGAFNGNDVFLQLLATRSLSYLSEVFNQYQGVAGEYIVDAIKRDAPEEVKSHLFTIVSCIHTACGGYAQFLIDSIQRGRNDICWLLIHTIVSRCEVDLRQIIEEVENKCRLSFGKLIRQSFPHDDNLCYLLLLISAVPDIPRIV